MRPAVFLAAAALPALVAAQSAVVTTVQTTIATWDGNRNPTTIVTNVAVTITPSASPSDSAQPSNSGNSGSGSATPAPSGSGSDSGSATPTSASKTSSQSPLPTAPSDIDGGGGGPGGAPVPGATQAGMNFGPDDGYISSAMTLRAGAMAATVVSVAACAVSLFW